MGKSAARKSQLLEVNHSKGLAMESVQKESVRKRALPSVCSTECADSDKTDFALMARFSQGFAPKAKAKASPCPMP